MDGMTAWNTNLSSAINRCLEKVDSKEKITVDVMICGSSQREEESETSHYALSNYFRSNAIEKYYVNSNSLQAAMKAAPEVNYRYII